MQHPATPPRFDIYRDVHKGLRAFMGDTLVRLGRADSDDPDDLQGALEQVRTLLRICHSHLEHENAFLHAALEARRPGAAAQTSEEHEEHERAIRELLSEVEAVEDAAEPGARGAASLRLYRRLALFVAENLEHMQVEEGTLTAALWACYSDEELRAVQQSLMRAVDPADMAVFLRWIVPAISHADRLAMLGGMRQSAPAEVFEGVLEMTRNQLSARDWDKLRSGLGLVGLAA